MSRIFAILTRIAQGLVRDFPERVLEQPTILGVDKLGPDGPTIKCVVKTPPTKQWDVTREWLRRIKEEFDKEGIDLASRPTMVLTTEELAKAEAKRN